MLKQGTLKIKVDLSYKDGKLVFDTLLAEVDKFIERLSSNPSLVCDQPDVTLIGEGIE